MNVDNSVLDAYHRGGRVRVLNTSTGRSRTGIVTRSTGQAATFLLIHRDNGSSTDVLGPDDRVTAEQQGRDWLEF